MRLHPLIKDRCEKQRFEEDPERFRAIHRGICVALARRGQVVAALRHAVEANDADLLGPIAEGQGGVRLWMEQGLEALRTVDNLLSEPIRASYPRLALVRCIVLTALAARGPGVQIERLFESLMRYYPIGSFLFWRVGRSMF